MSDICKNGKLQAPINIRNSNAKQCEGNCDLTFYYRSSICSIQNNEGNLVLEYDAGSYVNYNSIVYELNKISFSVPAANKIDGSTYSMEMFIWHKSMDIGKVLIISVFLDINEANSKSKSFFDLLSNDLPKKSGSENNYNTPEDWNIYNALPENKGFYLYSGSLPQPPCTENVTWIVMDSPVNISSTVYNNIKNIIGKNSRQIQKNYNRVVYYNPNTDSKNNRNYGSKLRCYTDTELRTKCNCMCKNGKTITSYQNLNISASTIIIIAIIIVVVVVIYYAIKHKLLHNFFGKIRDYIVNKPLVLSVSK